MEESNVGVTPEGSKERVTDESFEEVRGFRDAAHL